MHVFDASSIILAWDNYPEGQFPLFWSWIKQEITENKLILPGQAAKEIEKHDPECYKWFKDFGVKIIQADNKIVLEAVRIKNILGIENDEYHPKGVGENDIIIIATAKVRKMSLVSNEGVQANPKSMTSMKKYKIPAVCDLPAVGVICVPLIKYIRSSGGIFG